MTRAPVGGPSHGRINSNDESGAVAVLVALLLPILLICVAFAVDVSRWYLELQRLQRAADSGALAAAPLMPNSLAQRDTPPYKAALAAVSRNGYPESSATASAVTLPSGGTVPTQVRVQVRTNVDNIFASIVGWGTISLAREAVADFTGPVAMGSPCNVFGNELMETAPKGSAACPTLADNKGYWMNIAGPNTNKARGDGYSSAWCTRPDTSVPVTGEPFLIDRCSGTNDSGASPEDNLDWASFPGYVYKVRVKAGVTGLNLQGYDMGWVATGDNCTEGSLLGSSTDPRYGWGRTNNGLLTGTPSNSGSAIDTPARPYCTGDTQMSLPEGDESTVTTTITVRAPSDNPYTPLDAPVLCELTLAGYPRSTSLGTLTSDPVLNATFHKWASITDPALGAAGTDCGELDVSPGDYSIQVRTYTGGTPLGGGQNRFALRAFPTTGSAASLSMFAVDQVSFFNNVTAGTSYFNLVRLDSSAAAHTLRVKFYDLGDATQDVTAQVLQPDGAVYGTVDSDPFQPMSPCTGFGPRTGVLANCAVVTRASTNGGRWQTIEIPIPSTYRCKVDSDQGTCWVRIKLDTGAAQSDTTTWGAELLGDPVRIVE